MPAGHVVFFPYLLRCTCESLPVRNQGINKQIVDRVAVADASPVPRKVKPCERAWYRNGRPLQPWEIFKQVDCKTHMQKK